MAGFRVSFAFPWPDSSSCPAPPLERVGTQRKETQMSEPTATIPQIAEIVQLLGTSPTRASTVLSILAHVGYNSESTPAASKAVSIVDESTAVERVAEYFALPVLPVWFDSLKDHADFFPTGLDKAPTCGSPKNSATTDPEVIHNWSAQHR